MRENTLFTQWKVSTTKNVSINVCFVIFPKNFNIMINILKLNIFLFAKVDNVYKPNKYHKTDRKANPYYLNTILIKSIIPSESPLWNCKSEGQKNTSSLQKLSTIISKIPKTP